MGHDRSFAEGSRPSLVLAHAARDLDRRFTDGLFYVSDPPSGAEAQGNPRGPYAPSRERARLNSEFISALLRDFRQGGPKAIERVRRTQPAAYLKILALLMPREHKVEHRNPVKDVSDEQIERSIEVIKQILAEREAGANAKVIEEEAEVVPSLPAPGSGGTKMPTA